MTRTTRRPRTLARIIKDRGWAVQMVGGGGCDAPGCCGSADDQPFAYTVGLHGRGHPELLIHGLDPHTSLQVLNDVAGRVTRGLPLVPDRLLESPAWGFRLATEHLPNPAEILLAANKYYRLRRPRSVSALQLSYDDILGRFPWQEGCVTRKAQPRPGTFRA